LEPANALTPLLPTDAKARKDTPIARGVLDYFPLAIAAVAQCSAKAGQQHTPGELKWDRSKSTDHADCAMRHFMERGTVDIDGVRHSTKAAWRLMALLQVELEDEAKRLAAPPPPLCPPPPGYLIPVCVHGHRLTKRCYHCKPW